MAVSSLFKDFISNESGAATVDWVVLTGLMVAMGIATTNVVGNSMSILAHEINANLAADRDLNPFDVPLGEEGAGGEEFVDPAADMGDDNDGEDDA